MEHVSLKNCLPLTDLKQLIILKKQQVKIIDVRSKEEFRERHIPGAINIELAQIDTVTQLFDKDDILVTVCGKGGGRSTDASERLKDIGFKNVYWLCGGTFGWFELK
jgi:rhodanese-related sulfurtransferase